MKKLIYPLFGLAALAMTNTSCSDELENGTNNGNEVTVSFNVQLENATSSRALIGDGTTAKELQYAVYKADGDGIGTIINALSKETTIKDDLTAEVTFTLVKGQTYNFMFWAQKPGMDETPNNAYYTVDKSSGKITVSYANAAANDEGRDAFYAVEKAVKVTGPINKTITLKRPFAQINVGTSIGSLADAVTANVNINKSSMTIKKAANELNMYDGTVSATDKAVDVTYTSAVIPETTEAPEADKGGLKDVVLNGAKANYEYLAMNYILVDDHNKVDGNVENGAQKGSVNVEFTIYDDDEAINTFNVPNVTVQRNWRTNIIGDIMNESVTFNIVIDPKFDNDHNYVTDEELDYVLKNGGEYTLTEDLVLTEQMEVNADVVLNLNNKSLTVNPENSEIAIKVAEDYKLTVKGNGTVSTEKTLLYAAYGDIEIQSGTHKAALEVVEANGGKAVITGGIFETSEEYNKMRWTLNLKDNTGATIEVYGGTFKEFDPSAGNTENPDQNFVAKGYKSVQIDGTEDYIVVPETVTVLATEAALSSLTDGATYVLANEIKLTEAVTISKDVKIQGGTISGKPMHVAADANVTFDGVTFKNAAENKESSLYLNNYAGNVVINNCVFEGFKWEALQIIPVDGAKITVTNNTFVAPAAEAQRYLHIEADKTNGTNAAIVVTGNTFGSVKTIKNCAIDIDYVKAFNQITAGNNVFADEASALADHFYICLNGGETIYDAAKAYNAFVATENKNLE